MIKKILFAGLLTVSSSVVMALPMITGNIGFTGSASYTTNVAENAVAEVTFVSVETEGAATGSFSGILDATTVTYASPWTVGPVSPLWTVGDFTFEVTSIVGNEVGLFGGSIIASITAIGILSGVGYEDTTGEWFFSKQNGQSTGTFSANAVPAPAALALLGLGLVGMTLVRRNKKTA